MAYEVTEESFDSLTFYWLTDLRLKWGSLFALPAWLKAWWQVFGLGKELHLRAVKDEGRVLGVAPLFIEGGKAFLLGSEDICDYLDFAVIPGRESDFFEVLLCYLKAQGVRELKLETLRPDSIVITHLGNIAQRWGDISAERVATSFELDLPSTWEEYLGMLQTKQRHELRRKMRRLEEEGKIVYEVVEDKGEVPEYLEQFLSLFAQSREDKASFLTREREEFFHLISQAMAEFGLFRFGVLSLDGRVVAMVMYFDWDNAFYLYNSGYDPEYSFLSVGIISKALCIKEAIKLGRRRFDFLKGEERYKRHLGGREVQLSSFTLKFG